MKKFNKIFQYFLYSMLLIWCITSCKKYDYPFENGYVSSGDSAKISVDTSLFATDKSMLAQAKVFPGLVSDDEPRIADTAITIDISYSPVAAIGFVSASSPQPLFSTGLYDAPGEYVLITVPDGVFGLNAIVGSHTDDLTGLSNPRRVEIISTKVALFPGTNLVRNLFGGYIWIQPNTPGAGSVTLHFQNAVRAPDYVLGSTDLNSWQNELLKSGTPWLELRSKRIAFSFQRNMVERAITTGAFDNVSDVMAEWDKIITEDLFGWTGAPISKLPYRAVLDIQPAGVSDIHGPQPIVAQNNTFWFGEWTTLSKLKTAATSGIYTYLLDGLKQTNDIWWGSISGASPLLFKFKTALRNDMVPDLSEEGDINYQAATAIAYALDQNRGKDLGNDSISKNHIFQSIPFLQIFDKMNNPATGEDGWAFMTYWLKQAREQSFWNNSNMGKINFFYQALSDFTQRDCFGFFDAWGIPVSDFYRDIVSQKYPPLERAIWGYNPISKTGGDDLPSRREIYNRANWEATASSYNYNGEIAYPDYIIDGDPGTYWHSCYNGCTAPIEYPQTIWVDMKEAKSVSGVYFRQRGQRNIKSVSVGVSDDGVNYTDLLTFDLPNISYRQYFEFPSVQNARYLRISVNDVGWDGSIYTALSEFGAYYDY